MKWAADPEDLKKRQEALVIPDTKEWRVGRICSIQIILLWEMLKCNSQNKNHIVNYAQNQYFFFSLYYLLNTYHFTLSLFCFSAGLSSMKSIILEFHIQSTYWFVSQFNRLILDCLHEICMQVYHWVEKVVVGRRIRWIKLKRWTGIVDRILNWLSDLKNEMDTWKYAYARTNAR